MRNSDGTNQDDRETKSQPAGQEVELTLVEFWRTQLNRVKEYAESQPINRGSRND